MKVAEQLSLGSPNFDDGPRLIEKMLWKFGFTRPRYDDRLHRMEGQIAAFKDELLRASDPMREEDRERIREKGVNLFVNLEYFIEELVAYNAWLFGSDHFLGTKFVYDRINALEVVAETVGDMIEAGDHQLVWKRQGGNTLGVLLAYATAVSDKVKELPTASRETLGRPTDELPHYDDKARFVFRHREAWADFSEIETKAYSDQLSKLVSLLSRGRIDFVRNGLDHFREEGKFPEIEVLTNFATFVEQALQSAVVHRLYPVALWLRLASEDEMGRQQFELTDYRGREVRIFRPGLVLGLRSVRFGVPYVIPGVNLIGHANSELCFEIREQSGFSQMWKDYPIRQSWASKTLDVPEAGSA